MAKSMKAIAQTAGEKELTVEERNLLSVGAFSSLLFLARPPSPSPASPALSLAAAATAPPPSYL